MPLAKYFSTRQINERVFHLRLLFAGDHLYVNPRAWPLCCREHHAYSDTDKDPHSPYFFRDVLR